MTRRQTEQLTAALSGATAVSALGGSIYGLTGAPAVPREWLERSPFRDYRLPSLVLATIVGGGSARASLKAWRGSEDAGAASTLAGAVLTGWIVAQVKMIGFRSGLQPAMAVVGLSLIGLGRRLGAAGSPRCPRPPGLT